MCYERRASTFLAIFGVVFLLLFLGVLHSEAATNLMSVNSAGTDSGNGASGNAVISAKGRFVVFASAASDLVATDTNASTDVFVRDLRSGTITLVSVNSAGTNSGNSNSNGAVISADGRFVAFASDASDLVATDTNASSDIFVRDLHTGTTKLISIDSSGTDSGNGASTGAVISAKGLVVAFASDASNLVGTDTNASTDVFVRDLASSTTTLVSVNGAGTDSSTGASGGPVISADGQVVAYHHGGILVRDLISGTTKAVKPDPLAICGGPVISANGRFIASTEYFSRYNPKPSRVLLYDRVKDTTTGVGVSLQFASDSPVISANGKVVAFRRHGQIFVVSSHVVALVSVNSAGTGGGNGASDGPVISANGRFVAFRSNATDLVATDTNATSDVFVRDLVNGTTTLVSVNSAGTDSGNGASGNAVISAKGKFVAFASNASNLVATDLNSAQDVFLNGNPKHKHK